MITKEQQNSRNGKCFHCGIQIFLRGLDFKDETRKQVYYTISKCETIKQTATHTIIGFRSAEINICETCYKNVAGEHYCFE